MAVGTFVLIVLAGVMYAQSAQALTWSAPVVIDRQVPLKNSTAIGAGIACPSTHLCLTADEGGNVLVSTQPLASGDTWQLTHETNGAFVGVSCPSTRFCIAVDDHGNAVTSNAPKTGSWTRAKIDQSATDRDNTLGLEGVSCASATFCAAFDFFGRVLTTSHPVGGRSSWKHTTIGDLTNGGSISCPSKSLCVIASFGRLYVSSHPAGGRRAWHSFRLGDVFSISCPSRSFCTAIGSKRVWVSSNPTGGAGAWSVAYARRSLRGVSCRSSHACALTAGGGTVITTTRPTGGARFWKSVTIAGEHGIADVACPGTSVCVATDINGGIASSGHSQRSFNLIGVDGFNKLTTISCPTVTRCFTVDDAGNVGWNAGSQWQFTHLTNAGFGVEGTQGDHPISCATASLCAAVDQHGLLHVSTNPTGGAAAWSQLNLEPCSNAGNGCTLSSGAGALISVSCTTAPLCVADSEDGHVFTSSDPAGGAAAWHNTAFSASVTDGGLGPISCSLSACVIVRQQGGLVTTTDPTGGASAWTVVTLSNASLFDAICGPAPLCMSFGQSSIASTTAPTSGPGGWNVVSPFDHGRNITGMSCGSITMCVGVDTNGTALVSSNPAGDATAWIPTTIDPGVMLESVSCPSATFCVAVGDDGKAETATG